MRALEIEDPGSDLAAIIATADAVQEALDAGLGWLAGVWGPAYPGSPADRLERSSCALTPD